MLFTLENLPDAVVEFTSPGTRFTDLVVKWVEYVLTNIRLYIILDTSHASPDGIARVIIGSRREQTGLKRAVTGDPLEQTKHALSNTFALASNSSSSSDSAGTSDVLNISPKIRDKLFYKKLYQHDQVVDCGYLKEFNLKAEDCQSTTVLKRLLKGLKQSNVAKDDEV